MDFKNLNDIWKLKKILHTLIRLIEDAPFLGLIFETSEETNVKLNSGCVLY